MTPMPVGPAAEAPLQIRRAGAGDVEAIFRIRTAVAENHLDRAQLAGLGITPASVAAMLEAEPCGWVARLDSQIAGFSMIDPEDGQLFALFVDPAQEGRGVGKALLAPAEAALFRLHPRITLETAANTRAAAFYLRQGWRVTGTNLAGDLQMARDRL